MRNRADIQALVKDLAEDDAHAIRKGYRSKAECEAVYGKVVDIMELIETGDTQFSTQALSDLISMFCSMLHLAVLLQSQAKTAEEQTLISLKLTKLVLASVAEAMGAKFVTLKAPELELDESAKPIIPTDGGNDTLH